MPSADPPLLTVPELIERVRAAGQRAFPGLLVSAAELGAHLERLALSAASAPPEPAHDADLYLACACARADAAALRLLEARHLQEVRRRLSRRARWSRGREGALDEVLQRLRLRVLIPVRGGGPRIGRYAGRGPLVLWLTTIAWRLRGPLRAAPPAAAPAEVAAEGPRPGPFEEYLCAALAAPLLEELRGALGGLPPQDRALLRWRFVDGLGVAELAARLGVHRATVQRWQASAGLGLRAAVERRLRARLGLGAEELAGLVLGCEEIASLQLARLWADEPPAAPPRRGAASAPPAPPARRRRPAP